MHGVSRPSVLVPLWIGVLVVLGGTNQASASADSEDETIEAAAPQRGGRRDPDFLFGPPRRWVGVRGSWLFAQADSEIFDFTRDLLTIEKNDFDAPVVAFDLGLVIKPRLDAVFAVEFSRASVVSEYREFVDENDVPIAQETGLTQVERKELSRARGEPVRLDPQCGHAVCRRGWWISVVQVCAPGTSWTSSICRSLQTRSNPIRGRSAPTCSVAPTLSSVEDYS